MAKDSAARTFGRRLDAHGRSIHVIAVAAPEFVGRRFVTGGARTIGIAFGRLALLVRYVDSAEWNPEAVDRNRQDADWLTAQARAHDRLLERAMAQTALAPLPLFTIYPDMASLETAARAAYVRWRRALTRVAGKREWSLAIYRGPHCVPPPVPYVLRVSPRSTKARAPGGDATPLTEHLARAWRLCADAGFAARQSTPLADRRNIFRAAFLLPQNGVAAFSEVVANLVEDAKPLGLTYYLEGPRAPYSFV